MPYCRFVLSASVPQSAGHGPQLWLSTLLYYLDSSLASRCIYARRKSFRLPKPSTRAFSLVNDVASLQASNDTTSQSLRLVYVNMDLHA